MKRSIAASLVCSLIVGCASTALAATKRNDRFANIEPLETISRSRAEAADQAAQVPGGASLLLEALRYRGANAKQLGLPTQLWCADFMNFVIKKAGSHGGTKSRAARSFLEFGKKLDGPRVGAIAILKRGGPQNGHVGIVRGTDGQGNPILISGNSGNMVRQSSYPKEKVLGYVMPPDYVLREIANAARAEVVKQQQAQ